MKALKIALLAATATVAMGGAALADDAPSLSFNVGAATDYVFRGVSQTDGQGQVFGGADLTAGSFYAGAWLSNVDFNNGTNGEYDLYVGYKPQVGPVAMDLGVVRYGYTNSPSGPDQDYYEIKVAGSVPVGKGSIGGAVYYSPEFFGETGVATYVEINGSVPVDDKWSLSGAIGHQDVDYAGDYNTWNVGLGYALTDHIGLDLRYWDTDEHSFGSIYDGRVALSLKATY